MRKALTLCLMVIMAVAMVPTTTLAVGDSPDCDEYNNGNGMDWDCANELLYMQEHGGFGNPL